VRRALRFAAEPDPKTRKKLTKALAKGQNPSRSVSHDDRRVCARGCAAQGLGVERVRKLSEFVNYGPDLRHQGGEWRVFNRDHQSTESREVIAGLDGVFAAAVAWACEHAMLQGDLITAALDHAGDFFTPNADGDPFYSDWSSASVLGGSESARAALAERAHTLIARHHGR
jgi:hypothetical protein